VLTKGSTLTSVRYMLWFKGLVSNKQTNKQEDGVSRLNCGVKALNPTKQSTLRKLDSS